MNSYQNDHLETPGVTSSTPLKESIISPTGARQTFDSGVTAVVMSNINQPLIPHL